MLSKSVKCGRFTPWTVETEGNSGDFVAGMDHESFRLEARDLDNLFQVLRDLGYDIYGPTVRDHVIVCDSLTSVDDLPIGWTDVQDGGHYRLQRRQDQAFFGYNLGPQSWKSQLFSERQKLWSARRKNGKVEFDSVLVEPRKKAFLGIRACELAAIAIQDKVFIEGSHKDYSYQQKRADVLLVAVNCTQAAATCFCVSMGTGPAVERGFDLLLTEVLVRNPGATEQAHFFVMRSGSKIGDAVVKNLQALKKASARDNEQALSAIQPAAIGQKRQLNTDKLPSILQKEFDHPRWDEIAQRCLSCANCTMVCPTCFCSTVEDVTDVTGEHSERWQRWDSCFTADHSYVHGGSVRSSIKSRYRQWLTHKLSTWWEQFGSSGCVGCGRCVTWCPVGIDLTEEAKFFCETQEPGT